MLSDIIRWEHLFRPPYIKGLATQAEILQKCSLYVIFENVSRMAADAKCAHGQSICWTHLPELCEPLAPSQTLMLTARLLSSPLANDCGCSLSSAQSPSCIFSRSSSLLSVCPAADNVLQPSTPHTNPAFLPICIRNVFFLLSNSHVIDCWAIKLGSECKAVILLVYYSSM